MTRFLPTPSIRGRIVLLGAVLAVVAFGAGMQALVELRQANLDLERVYSERVVPLQQLKRLGDRYAVQIVDHAVKAHLGAISPDSARRAVLRARAQSDTLWLAYTPANATEEESRLAARIWLEKDTADAAVARLVAALGEGGTALDRVLRDDLYPRVDRVSATVARLSDIQQEEAARANAVAEARYDTARELVLLRLLAGLAIAAAVGFAVVRSVTAALATAAGAARRLARGDVGGTVPEGRDDEVGTLLAAVADVVRAQRELAATAESIAGGELRVRVEPRSPEDRVGIAFAAMAERLREAMAEARAGADVVATAAVQLAATTAELTAGAGSQAAAADGARRELAALCALTQHSAGQVRETAEAAGRAAAEAEESSRAVHEALGAVRVVGERVSALDDLAAGAHALALVAGVEAARAGEAGLGFAAVAAEVRTLAERSRAAALEIGEASARVLRAGAAVEGRLAAVAPQVRRTAALAHGVAAAWSAKDARTDAIRAAVDGVHAVAAGTAAATGELAATAQELAAQAETLQGLVGFFRVDAGPAPSPADGVLSPLPTLRPRTAVS